MSPFFSDKYDLHSCRQPLFIISAPCVLCYYDNQQYNIEIYLQPKILSGKMSCLSINPTSEAETCCGANLCQDLSVLIDTVLSVSPVLCVVLPNYPYVSHMCLIVPVPHLVYLNPLPSGPVCLSWLQLAPSKPACGFFQRYKVDFMAWVIDLILSAVSGLLWLPGPILSINVPDKHLNVPNCLLFIVHWSPA